MKRLLRISGTLLIVAGLGTLAWAVVVWKWQDPFTAAYTTYQQHKLEDRFDRIVVAYKPVRVPKRTGPSLAAERKLVEREARRYRLSLDEGDPLGKLKVPRLGLSVVAVNGTEHGTLKRGPGRYSGPTAAFVPGEGELVYIAGHRTTYGAPFAHINRLRPGDTASFELPYATFHYEITRHVIVPADQLSVLRSRGREILALQACHPRFFASHRYIAYARLVRVVPRSGPAYAIAGSRLIAA